ncbi:MAG: LPS export ABC transporter permease LptF [Rhizobiales bacterium PAR1]|nr:MAG: LPS export ABC transporter permease LptF [Rhizobiales bacterium PAR1]
MSLVERYIFRIAGGAFLACLGALTAVIWLTQALREMNLVTGKGQTILIFLQVTLFGLPALVMVIAPLALFIAVLYTLNRLNGDSELIVMNAAGIAPRTILRPLVILTIAVSVLVGAMTLYAIPESFRALRTLITKIRADVVTRIIQEGKFISLDQGIVFHFRERLPGGAMGGVLIHDSRDPKTASTYLAARGLITEVDKSTYLLLEQGSMQRQDALQRDSSIVAFERYVFDLDQFEQATGNYQLKPRERTTTDLIFLDKEDSFVKSILGRFRAELHDRLTNPLYPIATLAIAFAALGNARTTRQSRGTAIFGAVAALILMRIAGFGAASLAVRTSAGVWAMYLVPLGVTIGGSIYAWRAFWPIKRRQWIDFAAMYGFVERWLAARFGARA